MTLYLPFNGPLGFLVKAAHNIIFHHHLFLVLTFFVHDRRKCIESHSLLENYTETQVYLCIFQLYIISVCLLI